MTNTAHNHHQGILKRIVASAGLPASLMATLLLAACSEDISTGTLKGKVTNSISGGAVANVEITLDPPPNGPVESKPGETPKPDIVTDSAGAFEIDLPVGTYTLKIKRSFFKAPSPDVTASVLPNDTVDKSFKLTPEKSVGIEIKEQKGEYGASIEMKATVEILDGSSLASMKWTQTSGPAVSLSGADSETVSFNLPDAAASKAKLVSILKVPDRALVQAIDPHSLDSATAVKVKLTVVTSISSGSAEGVARIEKPAFETTLGIGNVPVGIPVLLHAKKGSGYSWSLTTPGGSAALDDAGSQNPAFTPDTAGQYVAKENNSGATLNIYAGNWQGAITGRGADGRPNADQCTTCHNNSIAPDKFTAWKKSGHAEIFTNNVNTSASYKETCLECHSVGYDKNVSNGGVDEAADFQSFIDAKVLGSAKPTNWDTVLATYPATARMANIQCESCHGPNGTALHNNSKSDAERVSLASGVCGKCHGEPPSHGRYQQWEESKHGDYELALAQATVEGRGATAGHCGRCHSAQGFLAWTSQGDLTKQIQGANGNATVDELKALGMTKDSVQPQTCVVCHDPHAQGTTSGEPNTATVRIEGNTGMLPAGFEAKDVGHGALCMTCHNSRNGLRNDSVAVTAYSAPHAACQTDVFMGQNAYLVNVGTPSKHALVKDTCTSCHMVQTDPPKEYSRDSRGTNHAFEADGKICSNCHGNKDTNAFVDMKVLQGAAEEELKGLAAKMASYLTGKLPDTFYVKDYMPHSYNGKDYDVKSSTVTLTKNNIASLESTEPHGQQGFFVNLKNAVTVSYTPTGESAHTMSVTKLEVQLGDFYSDSAGTTKVIAVTDNLVKAGWNYFLLHAGSAEGVHNPTFTWDVIEASMAALN
ncbi:MAG: hypothetical protein HYY13_05825 [Nitrospirae bacterium]|nr:hypothetical protein [Nitrospirota bacterium]